MLHFPYLSLQNYNSSLFGGNSSPVKWLNSPVLWCQVHSGLLEPSATKWERLWPFSKDLGRKLKRFTHCTPHSSFQDLKDVTWGTGLACHGLCDWHVSFLGFQRKEGFSPSPQGPRKAKLHPRVPHWLFGKSTKELLCRQPWEYQIATFCI